MFTGAPGDQGGPELIPQLLSFAIYSEDLSFINRQSIFSSGGAVGSNTLVRIGIEAKIAGDIVSGGNVELLDRAEMQGDITCAETLSIVESAPPIIGGTVTEHASVPDVVIPVKSAIPYGTTDFPVTFGQIDTIPPGSYRDLTVPRDAVITLMQGVYNFRSLTIGNNGTILFDVPIDKTIEINIETTLDLQDRAVAGFVTKGYAPNVKIYTNAYSIRIGTDVTFTGILTAPHAAILICSRTEIEGAVYAKSISTEPGAIFMSNVVNPNGDDDGDCVPNLTELMLQDEPDNGDAYSLIAVPHPAMIDNSQDQTVTYDFNCKYPYITSRWDLTYPAGTLTNASVAPTYSQNNKPPSGIPEFSKAGYKPIGNYISMVVNTLKDDQSLRVALPLFAGVQPMISYSIAWYDADSSEWKLTSASPLMSSVLLSDAPISDVSSMIIVQHESNMVAYLNDGMVYSNVDMAILQCNGLIDATADEDPDAAADSITIYYLEHTAGNPGGIPDSLVWPIRNNGTGLLYINGQHEFANKITVTNIRIDSSRFFYTYTYTDSFVVEPGQMLTFEINRTAEEMDNPAVKGNKISAFYDANALSFESMAFSEGVIKGTEGSWNYDYYLRDHLGSTRMVLSEDGEIQQALMYQPYGTVSNVDEMGATSTDPLRQKFTTKELDEEGVIPDDQRMALGIKIIMPDTGYTGSYTIKLNTVTEPYEGILYNRGNASDEPTLQCFMTSTMNSCEYYENIEIQIRNTTTSEIYTYRLDSINWAGETGYLKTYTLDRSLSEIDTAISTSANLFVESITTLGNRRMNLSYFGARYLDNDLGIWLSKDPSEVFFSPYAYTGNGTNPVNFIDPYGQEPVAIILGLAVVLYWLGHSLENYDAGMPPSYAFNPFKKYDGKLVWFSGTEDDLNQLSNSGAGINIDGENSGFYYDVAGQRNYPGEYSNNSAEANAAAIRNAYSKVVVPAPQVDPSWVISEGALLNSAPSYKKLEFGNLKLTVWEGWEDYFRNHLPNISENSSGYCLPYAMYRAFGDIRTHEEWIPMNENFDWCGGDKYKRNIDLEKNYVVICGILIHKVGFFQVDTMQPMSKNLIMHTTLLMV